MVPIIERIGLGCAVVLLLVAVLLLGAQLHDWFTAEPFPDLESVTLTAPKSDPPERVVSEPVPAPDPAVVIHVLEPEPEPREIRLPPEPRPSAEPTQELSLQLLAEDFCDGFDSQWDVWLERLDAGEYGAAQTGMEDDAPMISASVIKLFIMAAVYEQIEAGLLTHDTVYWKLYSMITISDNDAANQLITALGGGDAQLGMQVVNDWAAAFGCTGTVLNRLMLAENGLQNYTTARDCALLLRAIYEERCVSAASSAEMLALLMAQTVRNRIPANLPAGVTVGNKTGDLIGLCCADVGIVFTDAGDYILCVLCNHPYQDAVAATAIAEFSAQVYAHMVQE